MSSPLKTLVLRLPAPATRPTVKCCQKATFATASSSAARPRAVLLQTRPVTRAFSVSSGRACVTTTAPRAVDMTLSSKTATLIKSTTAFGTRPTIPRAVSSRFFSNGPLRLSNPTTPASAAQTQQATSSSAPLDWNSFFQLRVKRRRIQLFFSVTMGLLGGAGGAILLSTGLAEPLVLQIPLDPFVTLGLMTMACAGLGWLAGPSVGSQVFYLINRRYKTQMMVKESEFFTRVKKNRVDPSNSSAGNPVPDFYGEKIQSVAGYRRWLKDQRAFNRKKTAAFV